MHNPLRIEVNEITPLSKQEATVLILAATNGHLIAHQVFINFLHVPPNHNFTIVQSQQIYCLLGSIHVHMQVVKRGQFLTEESGL